MTMSMLLMMLVMAVVIMIGLVLVKELFGKASWGRKDRRWNTKTNGRTEHQWTGTTVQLSHRDRNCDITAKSLSVSVGLCVFPYTQQWTVFNWIWVSKWRPRRTSYLLLHTVIHHRHTHRALARDYTVVDCRAMILHAVFMATVKPADFHIELPHRRHHGASAVGPWAKVNFKCPRC